MITQKDVKESFDYLNGTLLWRKSDSRLIKKGSVAGCDNGHGYITVGYKGMHFPAHRIIFLYHHGYFPKQIDHINGERSDNRIENLRECSSNQNNWNRRMGKNNTSGIKGVQWNRKSGRWEARIRFHKKFIYLGLFYDRDVAEQVVRIKRIELHGEFANHG